MCGLYQQEYLNSLSLGNMLSYLFKVKRVHHGYYYGIRIQRFDNVMVLLLCCGTNKNLLEVEVFGGKHVRIRAFLPSIPFRTTKNMDVPFVVVIRQFLINLRFAMTINMSQ